MSASGIAVTGESIEETGFVVGSHARWVGTSGRGRRWAVLGAAVLAVGATSVATLTPASAATTTAPGPLVAAGHDFRDPQGRVVVLHGLFAVWKQPPYVPSTVDHPDNQQLPSFTEGDADIVRGLGVDAVRLAWNWQGLEPTQGTYDDDYLNGIANVQGKLAARGVYTVLDSHQDQFNTLQGDKPGFPKWATLTDGLPGAPDPSSSSYSQWKFPLGYFHASTGAAFANLYANAKVGGRGILDAYAAAWKHVAQRFAQDPMVAGYDLSNEPWPGVKSATGYDTTCVAAPGCPAYDRGTLEPFQTTLARAIRTVDTRRTVFYEPTLFFNSGTPNGYVAPPKSVQPAGLSFHNQCSLRTQYSITKDPAVIVKGHTTCPPQEALTMHHADDVAATLGGPPLMTEVAPPADSDAQGLNCLLERADHFQTGFTYGLSWSNPNKELRRLHEESQPGGDAPFKEMVLARVYPRAISGTPESYAFDVRTGTFRLRYTPRAGVTAPTVISVPTTIQYPHGYTVTVKGGTVTSAAGATLVTVKNARGATSVSVTIAPAAGDTTARPRFPACPLDPNALLGTVASKAKTKKAARTGKLAVTVPCLTACTAVKGTLKLRGTKLKATGHGKSPGTQTLTFKLSKKLRRSLTKSRAKTQSAAVTVTATGTAASTNTRVAATLVLKR
jgi:endoglycosylceramidase